MQGPLGATHCCMNACVKGWMRDFVKCFGVSGRCLKTVYKCSPFTIVLYFKFTGHCNCGFCFHLGLFPPHGITRWMWKWAFMGGHCHSVDLGSAGNIWEDDQLRWLRHLARMPPLWVMFQACPIRRRPQGRPRTSWRRLCPGIASGSGGSEGGLGLIPCWGHWALDPDPDNEVRGF